MRPPELARYNAQIWWHGGSAKLETINWAHPVHGGLHLGTREQAQMRGKILTAFTLYAGNRFRRLRDTGGGWAGRAARARQQGYDAIIYTNRHEGLSWEDVSHLDDPDRLSCTAFVRAVPRACDSLIILRPGVVRRINPET